MAGQDGLERRLGRLSPAVRESLEQLAVGQADAAAGAEEPPRCRPMSPADALAMIRSLARAARAIRLPPPFYCPRTGGAIRFFGRYHLSIAPDGTGTWTS